ncbi:MAG: acyltransferase family protein, partial [Terriglobales bacterium]
PMVVMGVVLGALSYVFDPFNHGVKQVSWLQLQDVALWKLAGCVLAGLLMLPSWPLPNRANSYFSLNAPSWSLMWEYLANIAFALLLWRMRKSILLIVALIASIGVVMTAREYNTLIVGYAWGQMSGALVRTAFSFSAGLLLYRYRCAIRSPLGIVSLSVVLALSFIVPFARWTWIYETIVVIVMFPLIVAIGAGSEVSPAMARICRLLGRISYPLYLIHYPVCMLFANYYWTRGHGMQGSGILVLVLAALMLLLAYGVVTLYDEPLRNRLTRVRLALHPPAAQTGSAACVDTRV